MRNEVFRAIEADMQNSKQVSWLQKLARLIHPVTSQGETASTLLFIRPILNVNFAQ